MTTHDKATYGAESNPSYRPEASEPHGGEAEAAQATPSQPRDSRGGTRPEASDTSVSGSLASLTDQNPSSSPVADVCEKCSGDGYIESWDDDQTDVVITPCTDCGPAPGVPDG